MWKKITINKQQIKAVSDRSYLIACPHNSDYDGFMFWYPAKCTRVYPTKVELSYTDDFDFRLFKKGQGKYNRNEVVASEIVGSGEIEDMFEVINKTLADVSYLKVKEPEKIEVKVEVLDEFKNKKPN